MNTSLWIKASASIVHNHKRWKQRLLVILVTPLLLLLMYRGIIEPRLRYATICFFDMCGVTNWKKSHHPLQCNFTLVTNAQEGFALFPLQYSPLCNANLVRTERRSGLYLTDPFHLCYFYAEFSSDHYCLQFVRGENLIKTGLAGEDGD